MPSSSTPSSRSIHSLLLGSGAALALFGAGFAFSPGPLRLPEAKAVPPIQVAAGPDAQIGSITPLPEEQQPLSTDGGDLGEAMPPIETYYKIMQQLETTFYKPTPSEREMTYSAIRGMLASLGDRYTRFLDPDEFRRMQQENEGEFGGIGAKLEKDQGKTIVKEVVTATPAEKAGLKAGDAILAVDGKPVVGMSILKVVDMIRGQVGSPVKLTIERKGTQPFVKTIVRDTIKLPTIIAEMVLDKNKKPTGIAHIELTQFNQLAHSELDVALKQMQKKGMKALIFDLRGNPGGLLTEAVAVGSRFVDTGAIVIIQKNGRKNPMNVERAPYKFRGPLVVLVNKLSASASEIVAGAIKDSNSGIIVGTNTWGKGLVQTITPIQNDGSAVLITTHRYLTPNGIDINKKGITPHVRVESTREDVEKKRDPQMEKAVSILEGEMAPRNVTARAPAVKPD